MRTIITYGTYDLFHVGHLNLLERLRKLGDKLIVGVSTDEFNWSEKGKRTVVPFANRAAIVQGLRCVDHVIPETGWSQKVADIKKFNAAVFGMGSDWTGKFDDLKQYCEVVYLDRTEGISSSELKHLLSIVDRAHVEELKRALDLISSIVSRFE